MRKSLLLPGLGLMLACSSPPPVVGTDGSPTDSSASTGTNPTSADSTAGTSNGTSSNTTGEVCPPAPPDDGGYDPCPGLCGGGGQCLNDSMDYAVCTRGCFMDCNCWAAPPGDGNAPARCDDTLLENTSLCVLDCSAGQDCPAGMFCVPDLEICAHPFPDIGETTTGMESTSTGQTDSSTGMSSSGGSSSEGSSSGGSSSEGSSSGGSSSGGSSSGGSSSGGSSSGGSSSGGSSSGGSSSSTM